MIKQALLKSRRPAKSPAEISETDRLLDYLITHPGFHTAASLSIALGFTDRETRQAAELSDGLVVSGPGSPGYCHISHCPPQKLAHIADTLQSQAKRMLARSIKMRRRAHSIIR